MYGISFKSNLTLSSQDGEHRSFSDVDTKIISKDDFDRRILFKLPEEKGIFKELSLLSFEGSYSNFTVTGETFYKRISNNIIECDVDNVSFTNKMNNEIAYWEIEYFGHPLFDSGIKLVNVSIACFAERDYEPLWRIEKKQPNLKILADPQIDFIKNSSASIALGDTLSLFEGCEVPLGNIKGYDKDGQCIIAKLRFFSRSWREVQDVV